MSTNTSAAGLLITVPIRWQSVNSSVLPASFVADTRTELARRRALYRDPERARAASEAVFRDLLDQAESTYFGKKHGLAAVRTRTDWKRAIPVRQYREFGPYLDKIVDGDVNVLTKSDPYALLKTSGSSGRPKLIPTTRHWRNNYRGSALYAQWGLYFEAIGYDRAVGASVLDLSWERSESSVEVGGYPNYCISQRPAAVSTGDWLPPWYHEPWFSDVAGEDYRDGLYRKLRLLASSDVRVAVALNPSKLVGLAEVLAERAEPLIRDVRHGTLDGRDCHGGSDRTLAARLDVVFARTGTLMLSDLWPNLSLLVSWNSASAGLYRPWLDDVTPGIAKLPFSATGTEGIVTMPVDYHPSAGPLAVDLGMYEFVPDDVRTDAEPLPDDVQTLDYHELEIGQTYHVVMSQASGLYRYDLGDRYTVVSRFGDVPRLDFVGRAGFGSSFTGEKLTEEDVYHAVRGAMSDGASPRTLFSLVPQWATPPGYTLVVEWPDDGGQSVQEFVDRVEARLCELNVEYAEKRNTYRLTPIRVMPVRPGSFAAAEESRRQAGASAAQLKHHWIQRDDSILSQLSAMVVRSARTGTS